MTSEMLVRSLAQGLELLGLGHADVGANLFIALGRWLLYIFIANLFLRREPLAKQLVGCNVLQHDARFRWVREKQTQTQPFNTASTAASSPPTIASSPLSRLMRTVAYNMAGGFQTVNVNRFAEVQKAGSLSRSAMEKEIENALTEDSVPAELVGASPTELKNAFCAEVCRNLENSVHAYDVFVGVGHTEHVASRVFGPLKMGRKSVNAGHGAEVALLNSVSPLFPQPPRALRRQSKLSQLKAVSTSSSMELEEHTEVGEMSSVTALQVHL